MYGKTYNMHLPGTLLVRLINALNAHRILVLVYYKHEFKKSLDLTHRLTSQPIVVSDKRGCYLIRISYADRKTIRKAMRWHINKYPDKTGQLESIIKCVSEAEEISDD